MTSDGVQSAYLVWPERQRPPAVELPDGYQLRSYREDDRQALRALLDTEWDVDAAAVQDFVDHALPRGLFLAETRDRGELVGVAGAVHNPATERHYFPFGGEVGYLTVADGHRRQGLGRALASATTRRFDDAGYTSIRVGTTNPAAVLLFLNLAYRPFSPSADDVGSWRSIYDELGIPFDPARVVTP